MMKGKVLVDAASLSSHISDEDLMAGLGCVVASGLMTHLDLTNLGSASRGLRDLTETSHSWERLLEKLEKDFPVEGKDGCHLDDEPSFPPRASGAERDWNSCIPLEEELQHLVLRRVRLDGSGGMALQRMNHGVLEDLFHPSEEPVGKQYGVIEVDAHLRRTPVWVIRPLPLLCNQCSIESTTYEEYQNHCKGYWHKQSLLDEWDSLKDASHCDPRHFKEEWESLITARNKFRSIWTYRKKMLAFFRAPMDEAGVKNMKRLLEWAREVVQDTEGRYRDTTARDIRKALRKCTLENVTTV